MRRRDYEIIDNVEEEEEEEVSPRDSNNRRNESSIEMNELTLARVQEEGGKTREGEEDKDVHAFPVATAICAEDAGDVSAAPMAILLNFVKVKTTDQKEFTIDLGNASDCLQRTTLRRFREMVATKTNVPPDRQRLIYRGKVLCDEDKSLSDLHVRSGDCVILSPRPTFNSSTSGSADSLGDDDVASADSSDSPDDFWSRFVAIAEAHRRRAAHAASDQGGIVPSQRLLRIINSAKFVAIILLFYFSLSLTFMVAAIFKPNDIEEEVTGEENEVNTLLPEGYIQFSEVVRPIAAVYGLGVAYTGLKSVVALNSWLIRKYLVGIISLAVIQICINVEVRNDYDEKDAVVGTILNTAISVIFWGFCIRSVYMLHQYVRSERRGSGNSVAAHAVTVVNVEEGGDGDA
eukprot:g3401.t1